MKAYLIGMRHEIKRGDRVKIYKISDKDVWTFTGEYGSFEEVTLGGLVNFTCNGKPRQCMPQGIGAIVK